MKYIALAITMTVILTGIFFKHTPKRNHKDLGRWDHRPTKDVTT